MSKKQARPHSYVVLALLAAGTLPWVLRVSAGDRGVVDFVVISLVSLAVCWNVFQLTRRLGSLGGKVRWQVQRTALFWILGLMNTIFRDAAEPRSWNFALGVLLLVAAVADSVALYQKERRLMAAETPATANRS